MVITLLSNQTIALAAGQGFALPWATFPAEHQNAQLVLAVKGVTAGTLNVMPQASWDTDVELPIGGPIALAAPGTTVVNINPAYGALGPLFRLLLTGGAAGVTMTLSAWLTPKCE